MRSVGYVMPPANYTHLQEKTEELIDLLKEQKLLPSFLRLDECEQEPIIRAPVSWQKQAVDACPTEFLVAQAKVTVQRWKDEEHDDRIWGMAPEGCEEEVRYWAASGLLRPPETHISRELNKLLRLSLNSTRAQKLQDYIERE
jgi:hypothetical protein